MIRDEKNNDCPVYMVNFLTVESVDCKDQPFCTSGYINLFYLSQTKLDVIIREDVPLDPQNMFDNGYQESHIEAPMLFTTPHKDKDSKYKYIINIIYHFRAKLHTLMQIKQFPFDRQLLVYRLTAYHGKWKWLTEKPEWVPKSKIEEVSYKCPLMVRLSENLAASYIHATPWIDYYHLPRMLITCRIERRPAFYIANVQFPLALIVLSCFTAFAIDREQVADRLSVTVTLLLAAVAYQYVCSEWLPKTSSLCYMSYFILASLLIIGLLVFQNAIAGVVDVEFMELFGIHFDALSFAVALNLWIINNVLFLSYGFRRTEWRKLAKTKANEADWHQPETENIVGDKIQLATNDNLVRANTRIVKF